MIVTTRKAILVIGDIISVNFSFLFITFLHYGMMLPNDIKEALLGRCLIVTAAYILIFWLFRLYNSMWEYAGLYEMTQCAIASALGTGVSVGIDSICQRLGLFDAQVLSVAIYFSAMLMILALCGGTRIIYRMTRRFKRMNDKRRKAGRNRHVMIVGAGDMGTMIAKELESGGYKHGRPVVFVDDNAVKQGRRIGSIPIKGDCSKIPEIAQRFSIDEIIIAIPSAGEERALEIMRIAMKTNCKLKTTPTLVEMNEKGEDQQKIRDVEITDLLSRPEVTLDAEVCGYLKDKTVLVTGGGGSIGSELCRQVALYSPKRIVIFDIYENNAFILREQLLHDYKDKIKIDVRIGSVQDINRLRQIFEEFRPEVVFHAAAHKHVPLMEDSPCEAVKNNIFGTFNTATVAIEYEVKKFVILSTDKAVNPTSVMGATKRVTERIIQYFERKNTKTHFAAVRFGNVLGSNGSVIPIFEEQIRNGGPVTVTHPEITRYFMTIPEAAQLVVRAGGISKGGEIFVLDMGEPVKILTLAENLIKLMGYQPYTDIEIEFSGLRPGEKLYEELILSEEEGDMHLTSNNKIYVLAPVDEDDELLVQTLEKLKTASRENVRELLKRIVPNFYYKKKSFEQQQ